MIPAWIQNTEPRFGGVQEAEIRDREGRIAGWHATAVSKDGNALGSGCHSSRETAKRVAVAEMLERAVFKRLKNSSQSHRLLLDEIPSSSGFAAGFDCESTRIRAVLEAHERWAWSKWIDEGFVLSETPVTPLIPRFCSELLQVFDQVRCFEFRFNGELTPHGPDVLLHFGVLLGFKDDGIFPGSRVAFEERDIWSHAAVEAWRHFHLTKVKPRIPEDIIQERAYYFAHQAEAAMSAVRKAKRVEWPKSELRLLSAAEVESDQFFVWRAIAKNFIPWHLGEVTRFVY